MRSTLPQPAWRPALPGGLALALAVGLLASGYVTNSLTLRALSLPAALLGTGGARALAFALAFLLLAVPVPDAPLGWRKRSRRSWPSAASC